MQKTPAELRRIALFASLSEETLASIASVARAQAFGPGELLILAGQTCQGAGFLAAGQVRVYRLSPSGREQVLMHLGPGAAFNTVPAFQPQGVNHATVQAVTSGLLYVISSDSLRHLVSVCPDLGLVMLQDFADKLDHLTDLVEDLSLRTVRARLARFLLEHAEEQEVPRRWTQDEMAARLGTVRDMIGRTLKAFADAGLLRMDRQRIVLLDRQGLQTEADG